jgi:hypothetical protein
VAASSSSNAWAVGNYYNGAVGNHFNQAGVRRTLIVHWNGRAWKGQPPPSQAQPAYQSEPHRPVDQNLHPRTHTDDNTLPSDRHPERGPGTGRRADCRAGQSRRLALAGITGGRRNWTVSMISVVSMPCRYVLVTLR